MALKYSDDPKLNTLCFAGLDEAGRGAWAGPVVASAVYLKKGVRIPGLDDSKKLSSKKRDHLFSIIKKKSIWGIGWASHEEVDEHGLSHATYLAHHRALLELESKVKEQGLELEFLLLDGRDPFKFHIPHRSIIKGDGKIRSIAAASILAKVTRDRIMLDYHEEYPHYAFRKHKGYGTKLHQESLHKNGACTIHRKSYQPIRELICPKQQKLY